jgi:hypothetical protein
MRGEELVATVRQGSRVFMRFFKPKYHYWISEDYLFADGVSMRVENTALGEEDPAIEYVVTFEGRFEGCPFTVSLLAEYKNGWQFERGSKHRYGPVFVKWCREAEKVLKDYQIVEEGAAP